MEKSHKNMDKIYEIMTLLIWNEPLPEHCREHGFSGNYEELTDWKAGFTLPVL
jgi:mRNA-degrading endonuclease YafQ of YafQ-DinJ toxin-antitoxin module